MGQPLSMDVRSRLLTAIDRLIGQLVVLFETAECANYFSSCGYHPD